MEIVEAKFELTKEPESQWEDLAAHDFSKYSESKLEPVDDGYKVSSWSSIVICFTNNWMRKWFVRDFWVRPMPVGKHLYYSNASMIGKRTKIIKCWNYVVKLLNLG